MSFQYEFEIEEDQINNKGEKVKNAILLCTKSYVKIQGKLNITLLLIHEK